jgi:hypothetical protein
MLSHFYSFFSFLLLTTFILNPLAYAKEQIDLNDHQKTIQKMNSYKFMKDAIADLEKIDLPFAKDTVNFVKQEGLLNRPMPKAQDANGSLYFPTEKIYIQTDPATGSTTVKIQDKSLVITQGMTVAEIVKAFEGLHLSTKTSFMRFFINDAHAISTIVFPILATIIVAIAIINVTFDAKEKKEAKKLLVKRCESVKDNLDPLVIFERQDLNLEIISESKQNFIREYEGAHCIKIPYTSNDSALLLGGIESEKCSDLRKIIKCVTKAEEFLKKRSVVESDRSPGKEVPATKKPASAAKGASKQ